MSNIKCPACFDAGAYAVESWYEDTYNYCDCSSGIQLREKDALSRLIRSGRHMPFRPKKEDALKDAQEAANHNQCAYRVYFNTIIGSWGSHQSVGDTSLFDRDTDTIIQPLL